MWGGNSDFKLGVGSEKDYEELPIHVDTICAAAKVNSYWKLIFRFHVAIIILQLLIQMVSFILGDMDFTVNLAMETNYLESNQKKWNLTRCSIKK